MIPAEWEDWDTSSDLPDPSKNIQALLDYIETHGVPIVWG